MLVIILVIWSLATLCFVAGIICLTSRKVGGLYFWRVDRLGESFYQSRRRINGMNSAGLMHNGKVTFLVIIGILLCWPLLATANETTKDWYAFESAAIDCGADSKFYQPMVARASSLFVRGVINAGQWEMVLSMQNSDNLKIGNCILRTLPQYGGIES